MAKEVDLNEQDIKNMLAAMWKGTNSLSTSSKFGQLSRLLIKVNYKNDGYNGDLDLKCKLETDADPIENISQVTLNISKLLDIMSKNKDIIDSELMCKSDATEEESNLFEDVIKLWSDASGIGISRLNL